MGEDAGGTVRRGMFAALAVFAYAIALMLPAATGPNESTPIRGYQTFAYVLMAPFSLLGLSCSGNLFALGALVSMLYRKLVTSATLGIVATVLGSLIVFFVPESQTHLLLGFYLWEASFAILTLGAIAEMLIAKRITPE